jgi:hypothetical protein
VARAQRRVVAGQPPLLEQFAARLQLVHMVGMVDVVAVLAAQHFAERHAQCQQGQLCRQYAGGDQDERAAARGHVV